MLHKHFPWTVYYGIKHSTECFSWGNMPTLLSEKVLFCTEVKTRLGFPTIQSHQQLQCISLSNSYSASFLLHVFSSLRPYFRYLSPKSQSPNSITMKNVPETELCQASVTPQWKRHSPPGGEAPDKESSQSCRTIWNILSHLESSFSLVPTLNPLSGPVAFVSVPSLPFVYSLGT